MRRRWNRRCRPRMRRWAWPIVTGGSWTQDPVSLRSPNPRDRRCAPTSIDRLPSCWRSAVPPRMNRFDPMNSIPARKLICVCVHLSIQFIEQRGRGDWVQDRLERDAALVRSGPMLPGRCASAPEGSPPRDGRPPPHRLLQQGYCLTDPPNHHLLT